MITASKGASPSTVWHSPSSLVWRSAFLRVPLAAFPIWCTAGVLVLRTMWRQKLLVGSVAAVTLASPAAGLLTLAALTPFGAMFESALALPFRMSEEFVLAFFAAWLLRATTDRHGPRLPWTMAAVAWLLALAAVASAVALTAGFAATGGDLHEVLVWVRQAYYIGAPPVGLADAARLVEGLALVPATVWVFRRRPSIAVTLPAALCAAGGVAAVSSVLIQRGLGPPALVERYLKFGYRTAHIADPNAAGSFFAMLVFVSAGMALRGATRRRWAWITLAVLNGIGLWFSESKTAIVAVWIVAALAAGYIVSARWTRRLRLGLLAALVIVGLAGASIRSIVLERDPSFRGSGFRRQFTETSLRMMAERPLGGVGIGRYYAVSPLFLTPQMAWTYGHENAHDFFLQVGAELGLPGLLLFATWIGVLAATAGGALARTMDLRLLGLAAGVLVVLITCLTGHPLLVYEVIYPFFLTAGLTVGLATSALLNMAVNAAHRPEMASQRPAPPAWWSYAAAGAAVVIVAGSGLSSRPLTVFDSARAEGFYEWQVAPDGTRFRWMGEYASVFVPAGVTRVRIPVRLPIDVRPIAPLGVEVAMNGVPVNRTLVGTSWVDLDVPLQEDDALLPVRRINLRVDRTWQPAIYMAGSSEMRPVGVQVGELTLLQ